MKIVRCKNKFFDESKAHLNNSEFIKSYLAKEFEKEKFFDLIKIILKDRFDLDLKNKKIDEKTFQA